jgi:hypothetical protein
MPNKNHSKQQQKKEKKAENVAWIYNVIVYMYHQH